MNEIINLISKKEYGQIPTEIERIDGKGVVNSVYRVVIGDAPYIFRLNDLKYLKTYQREKWCMSRVKEAGIPVSTCHAVGVERECSYMILEYIEGVNGADVENEQERIYKALGEYARRMNSIKVGGFGLKIEDYSLGFTEDWQSFIDRTTRKLFDDNFFLERNILTGEQAEKIKNRINEMYNWKFEPALCHGNLGVKNTVISPDGQINVIDWGNAAGHRAPHFDLAEILTWKSTSKYEKIFMKAYGISDEGFQNIKHDVNTLIILRLLTSIKWGIMENKPIGDLDFVGGSVERIMGLE